MTETICNWNFRVLWNLQPFNWLFTAEFEWWKKIPRTFKPTTRLQCSPCPLFSLQPSYQLSVSLGLFYLTLCSVLWIEEGRVQFYLVMTLFQQAVFLHSFTAAHIHRPVQIQRTTRAPRAVSLSKRAHFLDVAPKYYSKHRFSRRFISSPSCLSLGFC